MLTRLVVSSPYRERKSCFRDGWSCWEIIIIKQIHTFTIWLDKGWGNKDRNVVAKTICCWWTCGFAWWLLFYSWVSESQTLCCYVITLAVVQVTFLGYCVRGRWVPSSKVWFSAMADCISATLKSRALNRALKCFIPDPQVNRPISSQPFSAGCHGNRNWRPIWKVAWWARVSCRRSRMYGIQCKLVQFCPVIPYLTAFFFLSEPVSCRGKWIACSNGKRNRSFTKNIISNHLCSGGWNSYTDRQCFFFLSFFFLSIAIRSFGVHHTVPGYIDQNVFGLQRTAKKKKWLSLHEKL